MIHLTKQQTEQAVNQHFETLGIDGVGYETTTPKVVWKKTFRPDFTTTVGCAWDAGGIVDSLSDDATVFSFTYPDSTVVSYTKGQRESGDWRNVDLVDGSVYNTSYDLYFQVTSNPDDTPASTHGPTKTFENGDTVDLSDISREYGVGGCILLSSGDIG